MRAPSISARLHKDAQSPLISTRWLSGGAAGKEILAAGAYLERSTAELQPIARDAVLGLLLCRSHQVSSKRLTRGRTGPSGQREPRHGARRFRAASG